MSLLDSIKNLFGGASDKASTTIEDAQQNVSGVVDQGKQWVEDQGGVEGLKDKATGFDIPGTEVDDQIKDKLGIGK